MARPRNTLKRKIYFREVRNRFLIVCEGEKTEPNYFRMFPINKDIVEVSIAPTGYVTDSLVGEAIKRKEQAIQEKKPYNQVWCVFDRDSNPAQNFNRAIQLAKNNNINTAYSNEAFELWYLLHFEYLQSALTRTRYIEKLNVSLNHPYQKNSTTMYEELKGKQRSAIVFADKLLQSYTAFNPESNNPSTTVHLLVKEINNFL
ncbi:MAG: RloB family protein [Candidatus Omnitrophota bacterium]